MNPGQGPQPVLLVEDDASIARFVAMALEDLPLQLHVCTTAEEARDLLCGRSFALLITDLMLPGMSGVELIAWLRASAQPACPAVVFSAGIDVQTEQRLQQLQVLQVLRKPVSVAQLLACVGSALQAAGARPQAVPAPDASEADAGEAAASAIGAYFGGDAALFHSYRAACFAQLPLDLQRGQEMVQARDAQGLRRLAHSLKSVLRMLGMAQLADVAQAMEQACLQQDWAGVQGHWQWLHARILVLLGVGSRAAQ